MNIRVTPNTEGGFKINFNEVLSSTSGIRTARNYNYKSSNYDTNPETQTGPKQTYNVDARNIKVLKRGVVFTPAHADVNRRKLADAVQELYFKEYGVECPWPSRENKEWTRLEKKVIEDIFEGHRDDILSVHHGNGTSLFAGEIKVVINL